MSGPRSESFPILNWSSPDPNSDLGWINLEPGQNRSKFLYGPAQTKIVFLNNDK